MKSLFDSKKPLLEREDTTPAAEEKVKMTLMKLEVNNNLSQSTEHSQNLCPFLLPDQSRPYIAS